MHATPSDSNAQPASPPDWLSLVLDAEILDVRPILAGGEDPFSRVMAKADTVDFGDAFVIDAPFNPSPLRRVLASQGFSSYGRKLGSGHWRIYLRRDGGSDWEKDAEVEVGPEGAASWREDDGIHIDVRKLKPPKPLMAILRLLDGPAAAERLVIVHHDRVPAMLAPELDERGWKIARVVEEFANVLLWLEKVG